jgi:hypothetical protein
MFVLLILDLLFGVNATVLFSIIRLYLSPLEIRSIVFIGVSMVIGEALFSFSGSSIILVVFSTTTYIYLFQQMRMHLESVALHVSNIKEKFEASERPNVALMESEAVVDRPWYRFTSLTSVQHNT